MTQLSEKQLDSSLFAYPSMRKYPLNTKEAALNSYSEFLQDEAQIPDALRAEISENFSKAASYYEIDYSQLKKEASQPQKLQYTFKGVDRVIKMNKIQSAEDCQQAVDQLVNWRGMTKRANLQRAQKYVLWASQRVEGGSDCKNLEKVAKIAGIGVGDREEIENELQKVATEVILADGDREQFWKYVNTVKEMPDEDFYKEATLNTLCNVLDDINYAYDMQSRYGHSKKYPEEVVFGKNVDDLVKEASDLALIPSIDTTISKKQLLERYDKANAFLKNAFGLTNDLTGDELISKVASLDAPLAEALLKDIE